MITLHRNSDITAYTTFRVPAAARVFVEWDTPEELIDAIGSGSLPRPYLFIGGGSNLLFTKPFEGTVFRRRNQPVLDDVCLQHCMAGEWGYENLSGIPGTIFGATVQNAGAYGTEMKDLVRSVTALDTETLQMRTFSAEQMQFAYRHSVFKTPEQAERYVICAVELQSEATGPNLGHGALRTALETEMELTPMAVRRAVLALRDSKLPNPAETGSAGSFFRNPELTAKEYAEFAAKWPEAPHFPQADGRVKVPAAWLIDHAGLKGATEGGAIVWPSQPLVIANARGNATADDVIALENRVRREVNLKFHVNLIPEVQHI